MQNLIFYPFPSIEQFRSVVQSVKKSCNHRNQDPSKVTLQFIMKVKVISLIKEFGYLRQR